MKRHATTSDTVDRIFRETVCPLANRAAGKPAQVLPRWIAQFTEDCENFTKMTTIELRLNNEKYFLCDFKVIKLTRGVQAKNAFIEECERFNANAMADDATPLRDWLGELLSRAKSVR